MSDRVGDHYDNKENPVLLWGSVIAVICIVSLTVWWVMRPPSVGDEELAEYYDLQNSEPASGAVEELPPAPDIPEQPEAAELVEPVPDDSSSINSDMPPAEGIPSLSSSDPTIKSYFGALSGSEDYKLLWQTNDLLQRWVTVIDGAARGELVDGIVAVQPPKQSFPVSRQGSDYYLDKKGYDRFDTLVKTVTDIQPEQLSAGFHKFRSLFEQAYGQMGNDPEQVDNTIIRLLDRVINAPIYENPIELKSNSVNYTFADPDLEALPALEKQLIRIGPENTKALQEYAATLKQQLLNPGD